MNWYAVRTLFLFGTKRDGKNVFEERIVVFEAEDSDAAFLAAEAEAAEYAKNDERDDFQIQPDLELYVQDGEALIDGYEVWSQLFEANESLETFFKNRYEQYEYHPDVDSD